MFFWQSQKNFERNNEGIPLRGEVHFHSATLISIMPLLQESVAVLKS